MITCSDFGLPPGCSAIDVRAECEGWIAGLQDRFGDPPHGAYFWTRKDAATGAFSVSLCYDDQNASHVTYAGITEAARA